MKHLDRLAIVAVVCTLSACHRSKATHSDAASEVSAAEAQPAETAKHDEKDGAPDGAKAIHVPDGTFPPVGEKLELSDAEWKKRLTPQEYHILREDGTEPSGSGDLLDNHARGIYVCAACGAPLFSSEAKFHSGTGWPSFYEPYEDGRVEKRVDRSLGMTRNEVHCARCGGHLGHVFHDGPPPTGLRYCIDSAALDFIPADKLASGDVATADAGGDD